MYIWLSATAAPVVSRISLLIFVGRPSSGGVVRLFPVASGFESPCTLSSLQSRSRQFRSCLRRTAHPLSRRAVRRHGADVSVVLIKNKTAPGSNQRHQDFQSCALPNSHTALLKITVTLRRTSRTGTMLSVELQNIRLQAILRLQRINPRRQLGEDVRDDLIAAVGRSHIVTVVVVQVVSSSP